MGHSAVTGMSYKSVLSKVIASSHTRLQALGMWLLQHEL